MSTSLFYHTQGIKGFQFLRFDYSGDIVYADIVRKKGKLTCPSCGSFDVTGTPVDIREIKGLPMGTKKSVFRVRMQRVRCHCCDAFRMESLPFVHGERGRISKALARTIVELRSEMTILALAEHFGLHWETVKNVEKSHLARKYKRVRLKDVKVIGVDEIHMGRSIGEKGYLTIVRDLDTGAVLHVGKGKGGEALKGFARRLKTSSCKIQAVAMDFSPAFGKWAADNLSGATIVYDHFHLIKLMNDKIDDIRRKTMSQLDENEKKALKNRRWLFVRNEENLLPDAREELEVCRNKFADLGTAWMLKECLRRIYSLATDGDLARLAFERWCLLADESAIPQMRTMARTIRRHIDGILAYWNQRLTNAAMEGFNNKVGWLTRQAYGYRDEEYLILKIKDLPDTKKEKAC